MKRHIYLPGEYVQVHPIRTLLIVVLMVLFAYGMYKVYYGYIDPPHITPTGVEKLDTMQQELNDSAGIESEYYHEHEYHYGDYQDY